MPSMRQDGLLKRKSEVEQFAGTVISLAKKHNIDVPVNRWIYDTVKKMESAY
jgi:2-dehydropantoate 2-reductase